MHYVNSQFIYKLTLHLNLSGINIMEHGSKIKNHSNVMYELFIAIFYPVV